MPLLVRLGLLRSVLRPVNPAGRSDQTLRTQARWYQHGKSWVFTEDGDSGFDLAPRKPDEAASGVGYNEVDDFLAVKAVNAAVNAATGRHRSGLETYFIYSLNTEGSCMRIACLAWGSLLWKTGSLKLASPWQPGGPALPLEFARDSDDSDELAIVLCETASPMPTFYALLDTSDLAVARAMLAQREKIDASHPEWVGSIPTVDDSAPDARIATWLANQPFDAVVWTALPPKFQGEEGRAPTAAEAIAFLAALPATVHAQAEDYVRRVPASIRTQYRIQFEEELGWTPLAKVDRT